jgi:excisionase family DNA binding protein
MEARLTLPPELVDALADAVAERVMAKLAVASVTGEDRWLDTKDAAAYLGMSVSGLHKLTAARAIPFEQDGPRAKCWFRKSELDAWRRA